MCLSIPAKVISVDGNSAKASVGGAIVSASLHLVEGIQPGDYILIHTGFALQKIDEDEALDMLKILEELKVETGDGEKEGLGEGGIGRQGEREKGDYEIH